MTRPLGHHHVSTAEDLLRLQQKYGSLVNELVAANILGTTPRTLQSWRQEGRGPSYIKLGRAHNAPVRYSVRHLQHYIEDHMVDPEGSEGSFSRPASTR